jgi:hypothetical protein
MDGQTIEHKTEVKYLGVTLDNKLSWKPHITHKLATAKGQLVRLLSEMRGTFGTKPKLVKWAYTGVVRPKLTYVCMTWSNGLIFDYQMKELKKLDRLACRAAVTLNRTTPQAALNLMLDITPIHLHIQELAIAAFARLEPVLGHPWRPIQDSKRVPHLWQLKTLLESRCLQLPQTDSCKEEVFDRHFIINLDSFDGLSKHRQHAEYTIYTDGSRTASGTGSGFVLYHKKEQIETRSFSLHKAATVFQAEVHAIKRACQFLNSSNLQPRYVKILSDSQAAIKALASKSITSTLVLDALY